MRINRSLLNWGVFLIALGGIPLAVDQGWVDADVAGDLGRLWPLILVGIGLGLILRWTPAAWFGGALVAATFGIIFGAAVVAVPEDDIGSLQGIIPAIASGTCSTGDPGSGRTDEGGIASASAFELDASLSCGELTLARAAGPTWAVQARHDEDDAPRIDASALDGATAALGLSQGGRDDLDFLNRRAQSEWQVEVPGAAALTLGITLNAVDASVDAGAGPVRRVAGTYNASDVEMDLAAAATPERASVDLTLNASDGELRLPDGDVSVNVTLNASSLSVCVPASAAVEVEIAETLSSNDLGDSGLEDAGQGRWASPGFDLADDRIEVSVSSTVSDFSLERPESCA